MYTDLLRVADTVLAIFWMYSLVISVRAGRIGGEYGFRASQSERPWQFFFYIFLLGLMALHFGGLAIVGQDC